MLPTPVSYTLWPSVILANATTSMTVTAAERAYIIPDGKKVYGERYIGKL